MNSPALDLVERLRTLAAALPADGSVTFSRADLEALTGLEPTAEPKADTTLADLTVEGLAEELGRSPSTVRGWAPQIDGAYRLGREWRFPRAAVRAWLDKQKEGPAERKAAGGPADLGSWRNVKGSDR